MTDLLLSIVLTAAMVIGLAVLFLILCGVVLVAAGAFIAWCDERERLRTRVQVERVPTVEREVADLAEHRRTRVIPIDGQRSA